MTVISIDKDGWTEYLLLPLTIEDAAGGYFSPTVNLERPGRFRGAATMVQTAGNNDNTRATALINLFNQDTGDLVLNDEITGIIARVIKQVGTAGATAVSIGVLIFISK